MTRIRHGDPVGRPGITYTRTFDTEEYLIVCFCALEMQQKPKLLN